MKKKKTKNNKNVISAILHHTEQQAQFHKNMLWKHL